MPALPELLGRPLAAFTHDAHAVAVSPAFRLPLWANVLRVLDAGDVPQREMRARSRLSRRALAPTLTALSRWGWTTVEGEPRHTVVRLTGEGRAVADAWRPLPATVEARWRSAFGTDRIDRLRTALTALVDRLPLELPHYPATYGLMDPTIASSLGVDIMDRGPFTPGVDHGADWRPVRRDPHGATAASLPLYALLSQALVAFALGYEAEDRGPFEVTATVLRHVGDGDTPLTPPRFPSGLPRRAGYTVVRRRLAVVERSARGIEVVRLTERGRDWRDAYAPTVVRVTEAWCEAYGQSTIAELVDAAGALASALPPATPDYPPDT